MLPPSQALTLPEQPMRLSLDRALFGCVPQGASARQLVLLQNVSSEACDFEWDTSHSLWGSRVSVYPSRGTVQPDKHVCCCTWASAGILSASTGSLFSLRWQSPATIL